MAGKERRLTDAELTDFFTQYAEWLNARADLEAGPDGEKGSGEAAAFSHPYTEAVARFHVLPLLPAARMANLVRGKVPRDQARQAAEGFAEALRRFLQAEIINPNRDYVSRSGLELHPGTHSQIIVNAIVLRIISSRDRQGRGFQFRSNEAACMYLAQTAVDEVAREIESFWTPRGAAPVLSLEALPGASRDIMARRTAQEGERERSPALRRETRRAALRCDPAWLALYALRFHAGYNYRQISLALRHPAPPACEWEAAEPSKAPPALPSAVWEEVRGAYGLPEWEAVRQWFAGSVRETSLRKRYERGPGSLADADPEPE